VGGGAWRRRSGSHAGGVAVIAPTPPLSLYRSHSCRRHLALLAPAEIERDDEERESRGGRRPVGERAVLGAAALPDAGLAQHGLRGDELVWVR
jgi:hypothetical protein